MSRSGPGVETLWRKECGTNERRFRQPGNQKGSPYAVSQTRRAMAILRRGTGSKAPWDRSATFRGRASLTDVDGKRICREAFFNRDCSANGNLYTSSFVWRFRLLPADCGRLLTAAGTSHQPKSPVKPAAFPANSRACSGSADESGISHRATPAKSAWAVHTSLPMTAESRHWHRGRR